MLNDLINISLFVIVELRKLQRGGFTMGKINVWEAPVFLEKNRVWRVYLGGKLLGEFQGNSEEDTNYPEEWISSTVAALNKGSTDPKEGLSRLEGGEETLKEWMEKYPEQMLGARKDLGVLVKFLDSAIRLPVQVHPDRKFSREHLNSNFGKAEMWIVLATRENAGIYFGFKEKVSMEEFSRDVEESRQDKETMSRFLNWYPVKPGDVFFIPGKAVHAIGPGCLVLEIQEPTDFTIQPEYWCGDYLLDENEMYLGLGKKLALECFNMDLCGSDCDKVSRREPRLLWEKEGSRKESVITEEETGCFSVNRYGTAGGIIPLEEGPAVYVVTGGEGAICGDSYNRRVRQGDYFFMPYQAKGKFYAQTEGQLEIVECLPQNVHKN